ncbi:MAG: class I SAM-dependent methyltransferase [Desulfobacteraceae bacterium]
MAELYDEEAEHTGWLGPEVAFGLIFEYLKPGQTVLDIGIGTGRAAILFRKAGLTVHGMDISEDMLNICRVKGFTVLRQHDLLTSPYPFASEQFDHVICVGLLYFFKDLSPFFSETTRILAKGGKLVFIIGDRAETDSMEFVLNTVYSESDHPITIYRHSIRQIDTWLEENGFFRKRYLGFTAYMDRKKTQNFQMKAYLVEKNVGIEYDSY